MSQPTLGDRLIAIITGTLKGLIPSSVTGFFNEAVDFAYVRVLGLPFVVLGYRQSGKTTLLEWLHRDTAYLGNFDPEPTAAGGNGVATFGTQVGEETIRLRPRRDVGGEYAMWETDWVTLFREAKPRGIIFMLDHTNPYQHKDALNFVLQLIDDEPAASQNLRMILILVNKSDLWDKDQTLEGLMEGYRNEVRRLRSQAERRGYGYLITATSLMTGAGVEPALRKFFNAIRPRAARKAPPVE